MKIYYASQSFYPHIGGVSTYLLNLCREMVNKGNEVVELHLRPSGEGNRDIIQGIEVQRVPREPIDSNIMRKYSAFKEAVYKECHDNQNQFLKPAYRMSGYYEFNKVNKYFGEELRSRLEKDPADIVHIHDFQLLFTYKYVPRGTPLILTWHIPFIDNMSEPLNKFLIRHLKEYDKVVFSSEEYANNAVRSGLPAHKTEIIHPIANTHLFRPMHSDRKQVMEKYRIPKNSQVILSVQRVDAKSGHRQLVQAMPYVLKKVPEAKLVFVGGQSLSNKLSNERENLKNEILDLVKSLGLQDAVLWTGNIKYSELPQVYNACDVIALCSKNEGFGLSITEGMACGKPVVGTRVGGIPLQVENGVNGFLVEVGDVKATSDSLRRILNNHALRLRMGKKSLDIVKSRFGIDVGIEKHTILYSTIRNMKDEFHQIKYLNLEEIRAVFTDLDRTLIDKPAKPSFDPEDYDLTVLNELKKLPADLFLCTGRVLSYVTRLCAAFPIWRCVVAENGAVLFFPKEKKTIVSNTRSMMKAKEVIRDMKLDGSVIGEVIVSIRAGDIRIVKKRLGKLSHEIDFIRNVDEVMLLPQNVNKGTGVRMAGQYLRVNLEKSIVLGDGENDYDMFLNPGFKIAVANAHSRLKKIADEVTTKPASRGIMEVLAKLRQ